MKKIALIALAASAAAIATPAAAQVTGTVGVTGNVVGRCSVVLVGGGAGAATFSGTIALGTLDDADGTLKDTLEGTTSAAPGGSVETRVVCNSANVNISVSADTLATGARLAANLAGYTNEINYTGEMSVNTAAGGTETVKYNIAAPIAVDHTKQIGRVAAGAANNVTVRAYGFKADTGLSTTLLESGAYSSTITVTINPV